MGESTFLIPGTKKAFNQLRQVFTKAPILRHFDSECHIQMETDASGYAIERVLSQLVYDHLISNYNTELNLTKSDLGQWHLIAYFFRKMISIKTWYETHDSKLLAIVKEFITWCHYVKSCKHEALVFTDHNNLCQFTDTKSLSSCQVRWAQKLFWYYFQINYCQKKANRAIDALICFPQRNQIKENKSQTENT